MGNCVRKGCNNSAEWPMKYGYMCDECIREANEQDVNTEQAMVDLLATTKEDAREQAIDSITRENVKLKEQYGKLERKYRGFQYDFMITVEYVDGSKDLYPEKGKNYSFSKALYAAEQLKKRRPWMSIKLWANNNFVHEWKEIPREAGHKTPSCSTTGIAKPIKPS